MAIQAQTIGSAKFNLWIHLRTSGVRIIATSLNHVANHPQSAFENLIGSPST